jgi:hypothetical protein
VDGYDKATPNRGDGKQLALAFAVAWVIAGTNWGIHLAVAPAIHAYQVCAKRQGADNSQCRSQLSHDWADYSGYRVPYGVCLGLMPVSIIWLIGFALGRRRRQTK